MMTTSALNELKSVDYQDLCDPHNNQCHICNKYSGKLELAGKNELRSYVHLVFNDLIQQC